MFKLVVILASALIVFASEYTFDTAESEVYYNAKKEQFFSTYTVIGINKGLSGSLQDIDSVLQGELKVDVMKFNSDNSRRDSNVQEHMNAKTYPFVTYSYSIASNRASGIMSINGVSKELSFPVVIQEDGNRLLIEGNITVNYRDFEMEPPSNFIISAHDDITIGAKLYFNK